jgi:hypothetical protein
LDERPVSGGGRKRPTQLGVENAYENGALPDVVNDASPQVRLRHLSLLNDVAF